MPFALVLALLLGPPVIRVQAQTPPTAVSVDTVLIALDGGVATVQHVIPSALGVVEAYAIRLPGQTLTVTDVVAAGRTLDPALVESSGSLKLAVASLSDVVVRYTVEGGVERIPIFVPGGGAVVTVAHGLAEPYLVRLTAADASLAELDTETSMPRFERTPNGGLEVRLSSLPSFVRLSSGGPFSFARLADGAALLLILSGALFAFRRLRAPGAPDAARPITQTRS